MSSEFIKVAWFHKGFPILSHSNQNVLRTLFPQFFNQIKTVLPKFSPPLSINELMTSSNQSWICESWIDEICSIKFLSEKKKCQYRYFFFIKRANLLLFENKQTHFHEKKSWCVVSELSVWIYGKVMKCSLCQKTDFLFFVLQFYFCSCSRHYFYQKANLL